MLISALVIAGSLVNLMAAFVVGYHIDELLIEFKELKNKLDK